MIIPLFRKIIKGQDVLLLAAAMVSAVSGRPSGAPEDVCETMEPAHGVPGRTTALPYLLTTDTHKITSDGCIFFTIRARPPLAFTGFMVQARGEREDRAVGMFTESDGVKLIDCFGDEDNTATHMDDSPKQEVTMRWIPDNGYSGTVVFYATVAKSKEEFWVRHKTKPIRVFKAKA